MLCVRDADAGVDSHLAPFEFERRSEGVHETQRHGLGIAPVRALEKNRELVAAEPGDESLGRIDARTRSATATRSWSPALWPRLSLMS